jgi:hypothetical protein
MMKLIGNFYWLMKCEYNLAGVTIFNNNKDDVR